MRKQKGGFRRKKESSFSLNHNIIIGEIGLILLLGLVENVIMENMLIVLRCVCACLINI